MIRKQTVVILKSVVLAVVLFASTSAVVSDVVAQTMTTGQVGPDGQQLGETCVRRTDRFPGVVKVDACGRWYCGRVDINDVTVLNPNFARDMKCTWQIKGEKCKCVRPD